MTRLAVLPFLNSSGDPEKDYLADGATEYVTRALSGVRALSLPSLGVTRPYRDRTSGFEEVGRELQVDAVLDGGVRRLGGQVKLAARLTISADGTVLWSQEADRKADEFVVACQEVVRHVLTALKAEPTADERPALDKLPTSSARAFESFLRGRQACGQIRRASQDYARQMFGDAVDLDRGFALAHAGIADCHSLLFSYWDSSAENLVQADKASLQGLELAPEQADTHVSRGLALSLLKRYDDAEREFTEALRLKPASYEAHYYYARCCRSAGRMDDSARLFEQAADLHPEDYATPALLASVYVSLGRGDDAKRAQRRALERAEVKLRLNPDDERALYLGAGCLATLGEPGKAREWAKRAVAMEPDDSAVLYNVACVYAQLGLKDSAIDCLEQAIKNGFGHWEWIAHDSDLDSLRDHARFQGLKPPS
jgi:TolB-like protein/Tfp pilus assembly protein PilF